MARKGNARAGTGATPAVITERDAVHVALDVHKRSFSVAIRVNGEDVFTGVTSPTAAAVIATVTPYRAGLRVLVYEAGPTGYGLARALRAAGLPAEVSAPSRTPQPVVRRNKSDRRDCRQGAFLAERGMLTYVTIPREDEDQERTVIRLRDQAVMGRRRARQRLRSFLLYHGLTEPDGLENWSARAVRALRALPLTQLARWELNHLIEVMAMEQARVAIVETKLKELALLPRYARRVAVLASHPGVGLVTAMAFLLEVFRPERFRDAREAAAYLGLAPQVWQSGETRRDGPLVKAGKEHLRALLVEAAWQWKARDARAEALYRRLLRNTGHPQKAIVALARHRGINLWMMLCHEEGYRVAA